MSQRWRCRDRVFEIGLRPLLMGIVNVTPDSFSDGGRFNSTGQAVDHALQLIEAGADIVDIGGESSRPGATPVPVDEELRRVIPPIRELSRQARAAISVDTAKAEVAQQALDAGACIVNDVTALGDHAMPGVVRASGSGIVLMHMRGTPQTMQDNPVYDDVVAEIAGYLAERIAFAEKQGIGRAAMALDPGIGFGQTVEHTMQVLRNLAEFQRFGLPVCLGVSRKGFIGQILGRPREQRDVGSVAVAAFAMLARSAQIVRVHDVAAHRDALWMLEALAG
jgi:dihydropteroate synthase